MVAVAVEVQQAVDFLRSKGVQPDEKVVNLFADVAKKIAASENKVDGSGELADYLATVFAQHSQRTKLLNNTAEQPSARSTPAPK